MNAWISQLYISKIFLFAFERKNIKFEGDRDNRNVLKTLPPSMPVEFVVSRLHYGFTPFHQPSIGIILRFQSTVYYDCGSCKVTMRCVFAAPPQTLSVARIFRKDLLGVLRGRNLMPLRWWSYFTKLTDWETFISFALTNRSFQCWNFLFFF